MAFSGTGAGTAADPYIIKTLTHLNEIRDDLTAYYKLNANIDASDTVNWNSGDGWAQIAGTLTGEIDLNGKYISGLYINTPSSRASFLRNLQGTIKDGTFTGIDITGNVDVGGVVEEIQDGGLIQEVGVEGDITGNSGTGGVLGSYDTTGTMTVRCCYFNGTITTTGGEAIGGIVGYGQINSGETGVLENCYAKGTIDNAGGATEVGGLIGRLNRLSSADKLWAACALPNGGNPFCGAKYNATEATNDYFDSDVAGTVSDPTATAKTTAEMYQESTFTNYDFSTIWRIQETYAYPKLQWEGVVITTHVFDLTRQTWAQFAFFTAEKAVVLSRGGTEDNDNLLLDANSEINQYPGSSYISNDAYIRTKQFRYTETILRKLRLQYEGGSIEVVPEVIDQDTATTHEQTISTLTSDAWKNVNAGMRGQRIQFKIADADVIKSLLFRTKVKGV